MPDDAPRHGVHGHVVEPDFVIYEVNLAEYDLPLIPDGPAVERLRQREEAVAVARTFIEDGMKVASTGHGTQLLISAGMLDGGRVTCSPGIRDDVRAAGVVYRDEALSLPMATCSRVAAPTICRPSCSR